jgi:hypothetical protein
LDKESGRGGSSSEVTQTGLELEELLCDAISRCQVLLLGYERQRDGIVSLHRVAPIDIRPGETAKTGDRLYLWAYCYDEAIPEMHILERVRTAKSTGEAFDPTSILDNWPEKWPLPDSWRVSRKW